MGRPCAVSKIEEAICRGPVGKQEGPGDQAGTPVEGVVLVGLTGYASMELDGISLEIDNSSIVGRAKFERQRVAFGWCNPSGPAVFEHLQIVAGWRQVREEQMLDVVDSAVTRGDENVGERIVQKQIQIVEGGLSLLAYPNQGRFEDK